MKTVNKKIAISSTISYAIILLSAYTFTSSIALASPPLALPPLPKPHIKIISPNFRKGVTLAMGYNYGGDTILVNENNEELNAGNGFSFYAGMYFNFVTTSGHGISIQPTVGYRLEEIESSVSGIKKTDGFLVLPIDLLVLHQIKGFKYGLGLSYHMLPTFKHTYHSSFFGEISDRTRFKDALGLTLATELGGTRSMPFFVSLRYTFISYKPKDTTFINPYTSESISSINGNYLGLLLGIRF